ncbi:MAG TPA: hypothetical protein VFG60_07600 [Burkholderiaceae bacterium]|nr:hypothetical protein [Burkholderiaceae bacterium]
MHPSQDRSALHLPVIPAKAGMTGSGFETGPVFACHSGISLTGKLMRKSLLVWFITLLALAGCAKPVPPDKRAYVGEWQSPTMAILITQDGNVMYKRLVGDNASKSVRGPLQGFEGNDFTVGVGPLKTTFAVSVPPHEDQGEWKMTVDGVELTRQ